jgi:hypothetical protein
MGRQVTVNIVDLLKAGCAVKLEAEPYDFESEQGYFYHATLEHELLAPRASASADDSLTSVWFDCRNIDSSANGRIERALIALNIPYAAG